MNGILLHIRDQNEILIDHYRFYKKEEILPALKRFKSIVNYYITVDAIDYDFYKVYKYSNFIDNDTTETREINLDTFCKKFENEDFCTTFIESLISDVLNDDFEASIDDPPIIMFKEGITCYLQKDNFVRLLFV